ARTHLYRSDGNYGNATGFSWCLDRGGDQAQWLVEPEEPVDPVPGLLELARRFLVVPDPAIAMSPPQDAEVLPVGLPVWFWAENFDSQSERAEVPGSWVRVEAEPASVTVRIQEPSGDGETETTKLTCDGAGVAFDAGEHDGWEESDCSHVFRWAGDAEVEMTVSWEMSWSASNGAGGDLGTVESSSSADLHLTAMEAATH